jgi:hypothetical protein
MASEQERARREFDQALRSGIDHQTLMRGMTNYHRYFELHPDERYLIMPPDVWLRERQWEHWQEQRQTCPAWPAHCGEAAARRARERARHGQDVVAILVTIERCARFLPPEERQGIVSAEQWLRDKRWEDWARDPAHTPRELLAKMPRQ